MLSRIALVSTLLIALSGHALAEPLKVVASFSILGDMVRQIGGDQVQVITLVGPNGDAHVYQPTPSDAKAIADADLIVVNGLGFEGWFARLFQASKSKALVAVASTGVTPHELKDEDEEGDESHRTHGHTDGHGGATDPHAWQSLANGRLYAGNIGEALAQVSPDRAEHFLAAAAAYSQRLGVLESWVHRELSAIPKAERRIITSHDAFGYFGKAYGIELLAPVGISTEAEPTAKDVAALIRQMKATKIRAIFIEAMTDPRLIQQIAKDGGGTVGGALYSDSLSPADGPAPTYEAMFRHNVEVLKAALAPRS
ncbi:metal ABC transporter substrate-binding protein [Magnetospirillum molischianum]|uniref:Zinc/manganese transport system substrate-binding protein n=1 Tax=Magnetospirillum molischianum DSM 120 TaxID=1150626 RepID=H8FPX1_MAGML|nr:metal ABC transporter substrate-binding protein [Magnetospirillum molischianum]CCG40409.1 Zinc/manganese transport system substrate-binding protein [Magnetospirillum molischianum DSM 120]